MDYFIDQRRIQGHRRRAHQATQTDCNLQPAAFSVLTDRGKVRLTRHEGNVEAFEALYTLWQEPSYYTEQNCVLYNKLINEIKTLARHEALKANRAS
jgi:hypothetical protein